MSKNKFDPHVVLQNSQAMTLSPPAQLAFTAFTPSPDPSLLRPEIVTDHPITSTLNVLVPKISDITSNRPRRFGRVIEIQSKSER